jgi:transposase-like protein
MISPAIYRDETAARKYFEAAHWPNGPVCPFCKEAKGVKVLHGKSMGEGWFHCGECRKKFTVRVGTVFHRSHIPLYKWFYAYHLYQTAGRKGAQVGPYQMHKQLGITYKSALLLAERLARYLSRPRAEWWED